MIEHKAGCLAVTVPLVMANARALLEEGCAQMQQGDVLFDLGEVVEADSSAVAVMLGLIRCASQAGASAKFTNVPAGVRSLVELYGVADLIPLV